MSKKITIIGAGIAGLTAGCYARMNGFEAEIFESHSASGGLCTAWKRGNYTIDGACDWLSGSGPGNILYRFWKEIDAFDDNQIVNHEAFSRFVGKDKRQLIIYADVDRLEKHMLELSPEDEKQIRLLCKLIRKYPALPLPFEKAFELYNFFDAVKLTVRMLPVLKTFNYLNGTTIEEFADTFKDSLIRDSLKILLATPEYSLFGLISSLGLFCGKSGGYIIGGARELSKRIEKNFRDSGGIIHFNSKVDKILVENNKATGLKLMDGTEHRSDYVISAADMHTTLYSMLDGNYLDPVHVNLFIEEKLAPSCVQVSLGVNIDLTKEPNCMVSIYPTSETLSIGNTTIENISFRNFAIDPTMAPKGKTVITVRYSMNEYAYWENLYANKNDYKAKKEEILQFTVNQMEMIYPGITEKIEVSDVSTPMTYHRYANTWQGTYLTWISTPKNSKKLQKIKKTVPGLDNFWMSGMWVMPPGGLPVGIKTSRDVIQIICKKNAQKFVSNIN